MRLVTRLYDKILALLFGVLICVIPSFVLTLFLKPGLLFGLICSTSVILMAWLVYRMIKKNRAERRFFLDEDEPSSS